MFFNSWGFSFDNWLLIAYLIFFIQTSCPSDHFLLKILDLLRYLGLIDNSLLFCIIFFVITQNILNFAVDQIETFVHTSLSIVHYVWSKPTVLCSMKNRPFFMNIRMKRFLNTCFHPTMLIILVSLHAMISPLMALVRIVERFGGRLYFVLRSAEIVG